MYRHEISRIPPPTKSLIREALYRVLVGYASGGNHGLGDSPISAKYIYLSAADILADEYRIIERPQSLRRFVQLADKYPSVSFPNYGIEENIAGFMRQTLWELYLEGVLAPAPTSRVIYDTNNLDTGLRLQGGLFLDFDSLSLTPRGVDFLLDTQNRIRVYDPDGYLANFWRANPPPDPEMMRYLQEGILVLRGNYLLASVVLLGAASERLIVVLAEQIRDALGEPKGRNWYQQTYVTKPNISRKFETIKSTLMREYDYELEDANLKVVINGTVTLIFETIRQARNDIVHPQGENLSWNEVSGYFHNFVQYFRQINEVIGILRTNPK